MRLLVLSAKDVHAVLRRDECADAMRAALIALQVGEAWQPLRTIARPEGAAGLMALMASYVGGHEARYGLKAICITPGNPARGLDAHQGVVLLSDGETGEPLAVLNASAVTEIRTAAVSVVATDLLARPEADVLAVIGAGVQARSHIRAFDDARQLSEVRVAARDHARTEQFVAGLTASVRAPITACASVREAVDGAGIVVTVTSSRVPVLEGGWLAPGTHVNAVGTALPTDRELDTETMSRGVLFADKRESLLAESGEYRLAAADGAVGLENVRADLGELLTGTGTGRASDEEITIFKSLGLAVEDLAAARCAYDAAERTGAGTWLEFS
jgi:ornithine cyclodeaminase/alanine dehydrogenase-like protein (mu-crystallin family)